MMLFLNTLLEKSQNWTVYFQRGIFLYIRHYHKSKKFLNESITPLLHLLKTSHTVTTTYKSGTHCGMFRHSMGYFL